MSEHGDIEPASSPRKDEASSLSCVSAQNTLQDLWVDGRLGDLGLPTTPSQTATVDLSGSPPQSTPSPLPVDTAILGHISGCRSCRREADELGRLGRSLQIGLDRLGRVVGSTMDDGIETTLQKVLEESRDAKSLRRVRRPLRLVLWLSLLAFTFIACLLLSVALYRALQGT